jgi:hypothetical protein
MQACEPQAASNSRCLYCPAARLPSLQDYYQLLSPTVSVMDHTSVYTELYRLQNFKNEQQLPDPKLWIDIKALMGDPSDNIPGIKVGAWGVCVCGQPIHVYKGFMQPDQADFGVAGAPVLHAMLHTDAGSTGCPIRPGSWLPACADDPSTRVAYTCAA